METPEVEATKAPTDTHLAKPEGEATAPAAATGPPLPAEPPTEPAAEAPVGARSASGDAASAAAGAKAPSLLTKAGAAAKAGASAGASAVASAAAAAAGSVHEFGKSLPKLSSASFAKRWSALEESARAAIEESARSARALVATASVSAAQAAKSLREPRTPHHSLSLKVPDVSVPPERPRALFGAPLGQQCVYEAYLRPVPRLVSACVHALSFASTTCDGLFARSGADGSSAERVDALAALFEDDSKAVLIPIGADPHDIAALLLLYLVALPTPLLPRAVLDVAASGGAVPEFGVALGGLPPAEHATAELVFSLLSRLAAPRAAEGGASPGAGGGVEALAAATAPALTGAKNGPDGSAAVLAVAQLIANYDALFGLAVEEKVFELGEDEVEDGEEAPADLDDGRRDEPDV